MWKQATVQKLLLGNISVDVFPATREHTIMEETFSVHSVLRLYNDDQLPLPEIL
jgi:hypothetical protein